MKKLFSLILSLAMLAVTVVMPYSVSAASIYQNNDISHAVVHDPSLFRDKDGKYYIVGSHLVMSESDDMINWTDEGLSIDGDNYLASGDKSWKDTLAEPLAWTSAYQLAVPEKYDPENLEYNCWAHDVIYNEAMGKYCLYGAVSVWGATSSAIWLCVSDNIKGPYEYIDTFIYTGITNPELERMNNERNHIVDEDGSLHEDPVIKALDYKNSNIPELIDAGYINKNLLNLTMENRLYKWFSFWGSYRCGAGEFPNAIDPTVYADKNGDMWLVYGSFSGGCFVQKLNNETGLPDYDYMKAHEKEGYDIYYGKRISNTNAETEGTGEGPYIVYDSVSDYYYFFLTYGGLAGDGGYNIREYRSKNPDGPFTDVQGNLATDFKNTGLKLITNYQFECNSSAYLSGGHSSCILDSDGEMYQAYHTRFTADGGNGFQVRIHKMARTADGWSVLLPYEYQGEKSQAFIKDEVVGAYQLVDTTNMTHRKATWESDWSEIIVPTQVICLNADGTITGAKDYDCTISNTNVSSKDVSGTWSLSDNGVNATFKLGDVTYNGVFAVQKNESAEGDNEVVFSAAGSDNSSVWGVQHKSHKYEPTVTAPTCTEQGFTTYSCACGDNYVVDYTDIIPHDYADFYAKATLSKDGERSRRCSVCDELDPDSECTKILKPASFALAKKEYEYSGNAFKPAVTVKDTSGKAITSYSVKYTNNKNVGKASAVITFNGDYSGSKTLNFTIKPKNTSITKLSALKKGFNVSVKKYTTQTTGYQIQYSTDKNFKKDYKTLTLSNKTTSKKVTKLKASKKYFVRIRTYKTVGSTKYYSAWSTAKPVTTKK